nr:agmatine deiminase family protein [Synechococcus elongatus PCC 11802]
MNKVLFASHTMSQGQHRDRRFPAEWEAQDGVLIAWPHADSDWRSLLDQVDRVYRDLAEAVTRFEQLLIVTPEPDRVAEQLAPTTANRDRIQIIDLPTNDTWSRDFGPLTVETSNGLRLLDWGFNGWGLKFAAHHDNQVTRRLWQQGIFGATPLETVPLIFEGGSIESDGRGTLFTTSQCLLEANRNPGLSREAIAQIIQQQLGGDRLIWLEHGHLDGDDTDAHIDTLVRIAPNDTLIYVACDDSSDSHAAELAVLEAELKTLRTTDGQPYHLIPLPWPQPCFDEDGQRLPATYANYLVINGAVLVPTYGDPADQEAIAAIAAAFPDREAIGINCRPLLEQHGSLHCITMQLPAGLLSR